MIQEMIKAIGKLFCCHKKTVNVKRGMMFEHPKSIHQRGMILKAKKAFRVCERCGVMVTCRTSA